MDNPNYTTEHRKGQHLLNEERYEIEVRLKDGRSIYKIAKHLGRAYNTIKDEVERGTVTMYNGKVKRYKADQGKSVYLENREHSTRRYRVFETAPFLEYVVKQFKNEHWSLDAIFGYALFVDGMSLVLGNRILNKFTYAIRNDVFTKFCRAPFSLIERKNAGELKMRLMDDVDSLGNFIREQVVNYISNFVMLIGTLYLSFRISVNMTLYCIAIVPIVFLINYFIGVGTKKVNEEIRVLNSEYYTSTHNSLQFRREIKVQNSERTFIERFRTYRDILAKLGIRPIRYWAYSEVFNDFIFFR